MDLKQLSSALKWANNELNKLEVNRVFNSIGSNVFFRFGKIIEVISANGKKNLRNEWTIWISDASWKISRNDIYVMGSGVSLNIDMQDVLQKLLHKRFVSVNIISPFLDAEFSFDDGYKLTTFFNWIGDMQWVMFLPDLTEIVIDCSTKESIKNVTDISSQVEIRNKYDLKCEHLLFDCVEKISNNTFGSIRIDFNNDCSLDLGGAAWRLTREYEYILGYKDYFFRSEEGKDKEYGYRLSNLIGNKIKSLDLDATRMDARLVFEDGYILEAFTNCKTDPWKITRAGKTLLSANV